MPQDVEKAKERQRRHRSKQHEKRFGPNAGDRRGKHGNHAKGPSCGRWNEGRIISSHGYVKLRVGTSHALSDPNGYAYEHLLVWVSSGRRKPKTGETLHHLNGEKTDNRLDNLEKMTRADHSAEHLKDRVRDAKTGRLVGKQAASGRKHNEMPVRA